MNEPMNKSGPIARAGDNCKEILISMPGRHEYKFAVDATLRDALASAINQACEYRVALARAPVAEETCPPALEPRIGMADAVSKADLMSLIRDLMELVKIFPNIATGRHVGRAHRRRPAQGDVRFERQGDRLVVQSDQSMLTAPEPVCPFPPAEPDPESVENPIERCDHCGGQWPADTMKLDEFGWRCPKCRADNPVKVDPDVAWAREILAAGKTETRSDIDDLRRALWLLNRNLGRGQFIDPSRIDHGTHAPPWTDADEAAYREKK